MLTSLLLYFVTVCFVVTTHGGNLQTVGGMAKTIIMKWVTKCCKLCKPGDLCIPVRQEQSNNGVYACRCFNKQQQLRKWRNLSKLH